MGAPKAVGRGVQLMGRYMVELGMTPAARSRVMADAPILRAMVTEPIRIERVIVDPAHNRRPYDPAEAVEGARKQGGDA